MEKQKRDSSLLAADQTVAKWAKKLQPRLSSVCGDTETILSWKKRTSGTLHRMLGLTNRSRSVQFRPIDVRRQGTLLVSRILVIPSDESVWEAVIMEPASRDKKRPAWLCLHGCIPGGMAAVTGLVNGSPEGKRSQKQYACDYALQLANQGYVTMSFHFPGFGSRGSGAELGALPSNDWILSAMMLGKNYLGWCVSDAQTALSVLKNWPTVKADKIGAVGFSMGGTVSALLAATDPRVKAVAISGRFPSWQERIVRGEPVSQGAIACIPGFLTQLDIPDLLAAIAPTPLFISQEVRKDPLQSRQYLAKVCRVYRTLNAARQLKIYYDQAPCHRFVGDPLYQWISGLWTPSC
ncbi:MAG: alpha/beta hydrolase family protein [Phycisphaerae bacterium]